MKIYLNGHYIDAQQAAIYPNDRGLLLGDGIFETMKAQQGKILCLAEHYRRLKKSAQLLQLPFTLTRPGFAHIIKNLLAVDQLDQNSAVVRATLTRGTGARGLAFSSEHVPTLLVAAFPLAPPALRPITAVVGQIRRNEFSPLANIKSLCYLDNVLAKAYATQQNADECIMLNTSGKVACASAANLFIVNDKGVITPATHHGALPGITRQLIITICKANHVPVFEGPLLPADLLQAKEIFLTNVLVGTLPIIKVNSTLINGGKEGEMTALLHTLYKKEALRLLQ